MNHHTSRKFWAFFYKLPENIQKLARTKFETLKSNPRHPSLHFKKVYSIWSVRINDFYRAVGYDIPENNDILWFWIGDHDSYQRLLNKLKK